MTTISTGMISLKETRQNCCRNAGCCVDTPFKESFISFISVFVCIFLARLHRKFFFFACVCVSVINVSNKSFLFSWKWGLRGNISRLKKWKPTTFFRCLWLSHLLLLHSECVPICLKALCVRVPLYTRTSTNFLAIFFNFLATLIAFHPKICSEWEAAESK